MLRASRVGVAGSLALLMLLSSTVSSMAQESVDPNPKPVLEGLPDDFAVIAVGTYGGVFPVKDVQLDDSGHQVKRADVCVNHPEKPVVLVLTAYDPVVWSVSRTEKTKIAGVLVSGYHGQAVVGIEKEVPLVLSSHHEKGAFPAFYAYNAGPELRTLLKRTKELVGRDVAAFINKPDVGVFYVGRVPEDSEKTVVSDDLKLKGFIKPDRPPAGPEALEAFVASGALRPAKKEDIDAWVLKASEEFLHLNPDLRVETRMMSGRTYVVLGPFEMPNGLYGAHSRSFIIPEDVPVPTGNAGHCDFYYMDGTKEDPGERALKRVRALREKPERRP